MVAACRSAPDRSALPVAGGDEPQTHLRSLAELALASGTLPPINRSARIREHVVQPQHKLLIGLGRAADMAIFVCVPSEVVKGLDHGDTLIQLLTIVGSTFGAGQWHEQACNAASGTSVIGVRADRRARRR